MANWIFLLLTMKIKIDKSIVLSLNSEASEFDSIVFIRQLTDSIMSGFHFYDLSKKIIFEIIESNKLGQCENSILKMYSERNTFQKSVKDNIDLHITFYHSQYVDEEIDSGFDILKFTEKNSCCNVLGVPKLVLEDLNDSNVFKAVIDRYMSGNSIVSNCKYHYQAIHGGGNRMGDVCSENYNNPVNIFAICDSDMDSPSCSLGPTAVKVKGFFEAKGIADNMIVLDLHEIENLLPIQFLKHQARPQQLPVLQFLEYSIKIKPESYLFFDLKESYKYNEIYSAEHIGSTKSQYWKELFDSYEGGDYSTWLSDGNKTSDNLINKLSSMLPHAINDLGDYSGDIEPLLLKEQWDLLGSKLLNWFVGSEPMRL